MAYYETGDVFAEDPTCFIDELTPSELRELEQQTKRNFRKILYDGKTWRRILTGKRAV